MSYSSTAAGAAFAEAVQESCVRLPEAALAKLRNSLLSRIVVATPRTLSSSRTHCPCCKNVLYQASPHRKRDPHAKCWIYAEPVAFQVVHVPRWCKQCSVTCQWTNKVGQPCEAHRFVRYWCGFIEHPVQDDSRAYAKSIDVAFSHADFWLLNKSFGVTFHWLRRWRYRLLVHRASCMGEATIFHMMHGPDVLQSARRNLSDAWSRNILWRRAQSAAPHVLERLRKDLLTEPLGTLIAKCWPWYEPLMFMRRAEQLRISGDRQDIIVIDGNAKLHRRTCGMPFCEVISRHAGN